jgi:hypothetical protein
VRVTLTEAERQEAEAVGRQRSAKARRARRHEIYGATAQDPHPPGACAERAFAKWLGIRWRAATEPDNHEGDVGFWHVRSTAHPWGRLIIHPRDLDAALFVLLIGEGVAWDICGYMQAAQAKAHREWWGQPNPRKAAAWFVPQSALYEIVEEAAWA